MLLSTFVVDKDQVYLRAAIDPTRIVAPSYVDAVEPVEEVVIDVVYSAPGEKEQELVVNKVNITRGTGAGR